MTDDESKLRALLVDVVGAAFAAQSKQLDERFAEQQQDIDERFVKQQQDIDERFVKQQQDIDERFVKQQQDIDERLTALRRHVDNKFVAASADAEMALDKLDKLELEAKRIGDHLAKVSRESLRDTRRDETIDKRLAELERRMSLIEKGSPGRG